MLDVFLAQPGWLASCLLLLGLVVGSFLNVVVYRLPLMMQAQWRSGAGSVANSWSNPSPTHSL